MSKTYISGEVEFQALKNINLRIKKGEFISIMGPSGCGKSTLLHLMGSLDRPTQGEISIHGADLTTLDDNELARFRGNSVGFVFQFFNLYPSLTAVENVELPMTIMEMNESKMERKALSLLDNVGASEFAYKLPSQLSGGQRQRVAIARALANNPTFILADEPTGNLDSKSGHDIMEFFVKLNKKNGKTIIVVTHDPSIAANSRRIIKMKDGTVIE